MYVMTFPWACCPEHGLPLRWWNEWTYCRGIGWHVPEDDS